MRTLVGNFFDLDMEILKDLQKKNLGVIRTFLSKVDRGPFSSSTFFSRFILSPLNHRLISFLARFREILVFWDRYMGLFTSIGTAELCTGTLVLNSNNVFGIPVVSWMCWLKRHDTDPYSWRSPSSLFKVRQQVWWRKILDLQWERWLPVHQNLVIINQTKAKL